ncbi:MAG TPA: FAD-dependent oxidoreductase, partial [Pilimelia sp.]|nr:FAD-dependent oxidoreductase [Pilimelia sp.]
MRVVIVGYGMAGARLAGELRARDGDLKITILGSERHRAYNRILLSSVLAGKMSEPDVALAEVAGHGLDVRPGVTASAIDRGARTVTTADGDIIEYDHLVLATGSRAIIPPLEGLNPASARSERSGSARVGREGSWSARVGRGGARIFAGRAGMRAAAKRSPAVASKDDSALPDRVAVFRTLDDCRRILRTADGARTALVLGGGLLGLEAARGLAGRGLEVQVLHAVGHLMERQLDNGASAVLVRTLAGLGIAAHLDAQAVSVAADATGVTLTSADGRDWRADLLVVACGVRPETSLAEAAGLAVER